MCSVLQYARPLAQRYDRLITAANYGVFAKPGIQYLHFPSPLHPTSSRLASVVNIYFAFCNRVIGLPWGDPEKILTLANSASTAEGLQRLRGIAATQVIYPPVIDPGAGPPWESRSDTFFCVGRLHGTKRIELAIAIVRRLHADAMRGARLTVVGSAADPDYTTRIVRLAARDRDWIEKRAREGL